MLCHITAYMLASDCALESVQNEAVLISLCSPPCQIDLVHIGKWPQHERACCTCPRLPSPASCIQQRMYKCTEIHCHTLLTHATRSRSPRRQVVSHLLAPLPPRARGCVSGGRLCALRKLLASARRAEAPLESGKDYMSPALSSVGDHRNS